MRVDYRIEALNDLGNILTYIASENPSASQRVGAAIRTSIDRLSTFPHSGKKGAVSGTLELVVPRLPYIVVYRVHSLVEILSIFHTATNEPRSQF